MDNDADGKHILVCDDDAALRSIFHEVLTEEGYQVTVRASVCSGVDEVVQLGPDMIVLDLIFSGQRTGYDFLDQLKADPVTKTIPILVCTAAAVVTEEIQAQLTAWDCGTITKPFELDDLIAAVRDCIGQPGVAV